MKEQSGLETTPRSSRNGFGRVLRPTHARAVRQVRDDQRITEFFHARKRHSPYEKYKDVEGLGKRLRRGVTITDATNCSPLQPFSVSPITPITSPVFHGYSEKFLPLSIASSPMGVFSMMPLTTFRLFLDSFPVHQIVALSLTSTAFSARIMEWIQSRRASLRFANEIRDFLALDENKETFYTSADPFYTYGELLKALTVCHATETRVQTVIDFCESLKGLTEHMFGFGRLIHTVCAKWAFEECSKMLTAVLNAGGESSLMNAVTRLLQRPHGELPGLEMKVREGLCGLTESCIRCEKGATSKREEAFWMSAVLRMFPHVRDQTRIVLIMYCPTLVADGLERVDWRSLVDNSALSLADAEQRLTPLAVALQRLTNTSKIGDIKLHWSHNEAFNFIEEITTYPEPWAFDNFTMLLYARWPLLPLCVSGRLKHGYDDEAGNIIVTLKTLLYRWSENSTSELRYVLTGCMNGLDNGAQRKRFLDTVRYAHARALDEHFNAGNMVMYAEELASFQQLTHMLFEARAAN